MEVPKEIIIGTAYFPDPPQTREVEKLREPAEQMDHNCSSKGVNSLKQSVHQATIAYMFLMCLENVSQQSKGTPISCIYFTFSTMTPII